MTPRPHLIRQTLLALIGVLALLVQGALPASAMTMPASRMVEVCTEHGLKTVAIPAAPGDKQQAPCPHCDHCAPPALAVTPQAVTVKAVAYETRAQLTAARPAAAPYAARAPPRPPGQAPPQS